MDEDRLEGLFRPIVASIGLYSIGLKRGEMDRILFQPISFASDSVSQPCMIQLTAGVEFTG